jgi:threonine synthase
MTSYISTRGGGTPKDFEEVLLEGLAADGGLYVPAEWPQIELRGKTYNDIAESVMFPFVEGSISPDIFRALIDETYNETNFRSEDIAPLKEIYPGLHVMELFHGPTIAFKDIALQLLGRLFDHVLEKRNDKITIVGATSGDTGSAAIEGCRHSDRVDIFILHPHGRVSDVQRRQMTTVDAPNVHNIAVEGTFDDCQALVKAMFNDVKFRNEMNLSAVNSINWARIMAQIVYYVQASLKFPGASFVVPTGNFGNVFAAYAARKMGAKLGNICIATNRNDILTRFFETGTMKQNGVAPTISPSMDIQVSSNFERYLFDLLDRDAKKLTAVMDEFKTSGKFTIDESLMKKARADFTAHRCSEDETLQTMKKVHAETGYLLDPHSAVGVHAALKMKSQTSGPVITLATAHPAKFPDAVEKAMGVRPPLPGHLKGLMEKPEIFEVFPNKIQKIQEFIRNPTR